MRNISVGAMAWPGPPLGSLDGDLLYTYTPMKVTNPKDTFWVLIGPMWVSLYVLETWTVSGSAYKDDDLHPCQRFVTVCLRQISRRLQVVGPNNQQ